MRSTLLLLMAGVGLSGCWGGGDCQPRMTCERPAEVTSVTLTVSNTNLTTAGPLVLKADVYKTEGFSLPIRKVEFLDGGTKVAQDSTFTYQPPEYAAVGYEATIEVTGSLNGTHSYTARVHSGIDTVHVSEPVTVTINIP